MHRVYTWNTVPAGRWTGMSVSKSVRSTLVGTAIRHGYIRNLDEEITVHIPALKDSPYDGVTVRHLLAL